MALLLSVFMTMTYMPSFAFADTAESSDTTSTTETQTGENQNDSAQTESSENGQEEASQAESKSASPQADTEENAGEAENNKTEESVAAIGETGYATLAEAIKAAKSGDTITLKQDVTEDVTIPADADITLNTAKHTLTNAKEHTITVAYGGKLTVVGGGTIDNITNGRAPLYNKGTTVLKDVTVIRSKTKSADPDKNSYYSILNHGEMTIDGATVKAENDNFSSLVENGYYDYASGYKEGTNAKNPKLHIKNGTFSGGLNTIKNDDGGEVVIDDGTFTNIAQAVVMNWNVATINGGTYETELAGIHNGKYDDSIDKGELTINGGTFKTKNLVCNTFKASKIGTVTIKGGDFTAVENMYGGNKDNDASKADAAKEGIQVSGGTFKSKDVVADYVAEGFAPAENEDGSVGVEDPTIVATVGDNTYKTLAEAIKAAKSGDTIKLKKDVTEDVTIPADKDITLDTAKHTLTNAKEHTITVAYGGKLTVVGGGTIDNVTNARASVYNNGTVLLKNVTIIRSKTKSDDPNKNSYYSILNHGEMTIDGATVKAENDNFSSLVENGYYDYASGYKEGTNAKNPKLHIKNGTFSGGLNTIKNDDGGEVVIDDGTFTNIAQAVVMNWNVATINGGTYETELAGIHNGKYDDSIDKGELTINGGTFKTKNLVCNTFKKSKIGTVTIKGGDFTAVENMYGGNKDNDEDKADAAKDGIQVSGGTFKSKDVIADYVAVGFAPAEKEDGSIGIEESYATIGDKSYKTLAEAVKAAQSGDTITLVQDVAEDITIPADKDITLDTAKHTLTNVKDHTITVAKGGKLTVTGGGTIDNITNAKASVYNNGTVLLKDVTIIRSKTKSDNPNKNSYYSILNHGEMTIDGATVKAENDNFSSLVENGYQNYNKQYDEKTNSKNPTLHIKSGTFNGGVNTIKNDDGGEVVIDGGSFTNIAQVAVMNWNKATINGGTFEGKEANFFNGKYDDVVDNGELTINGGTFKSTTLVTNSQNGSTIGNVSVKGGDFTAIDNMYEGSQKADSVKKGIQVTGGTYKSKDVVADYTKDGYAPTEKEDGTVGIGTDDAYIDNLKKTNEKLQNDLNDAEGKKNQLQNQYETLDKQLTETKNKLNEANQEIGRQKGLVEAAQKDVDKAKADLKEKEAEVSRLQSDKNTVDGQLKEALEELKDAKNRLGAAQEKLGEKEKELSDSQKKVNDMQQQLNDMQTALNDKQAELNDASAALDNAKEELAKKDADLDAVQKKLDEANSTMSKLSKELEESQSALTEAEKVLKAKDETIDSVQKELATTQAELKASQDELQATKDKLAAASKELEKKSAELDAAQKELADAKAALEKANKTIAQMKIKNPAKVTGLKVKAGKKKVSVSYKKVASAQGYTLMISKSKKFSKAKKYGTKTITIKQGKTVKKTVTKLSSKKTYYVKVRAWKKVNGKTYTGSWSSVKKIKVK